MNAETAMTSWTLILSEMYQSVSQTLRICKPVQADLLAYRNAMVTGLKPSHQTHTLGIKSSLVWIRSTSFPVAAL
jgi:hypothetical protein